MSAMLEKRNNDRSCVHDAFVESFNAGLLDPEAEEIIYHLPDNFPFHSISQLCSMVRADLHVNCAFAIPNDEQLIHLFADSTTLDSDDFVETTHAELLRLGSLGSYLNERRHMQLVGFIAFKNIDCRPSQGLPEKYHVSMGVRPLALREIPLVA